MVNNFARAIAAGGRIFYVIDAQSPVQEKEDAPLLNNGDRAEGRVEFEGVRFHYGPPVPSPLAPEERGQGEGESEARPHGEGKTSPLPSRERVRVRG